MYLTAWHHSAFPALHHETMDRRSSSTASTCAPHEGWYCSRWLPWGWTSGWSCFATRSTCLHRCDHLPPPPPNENLCDRYMLVACRPLRILTVYVSQQVRCISRPGGCALVAHSIRYRNGINPVCPAACPVPDSTSNPPLTRPNNSPPS